MATATVKMSLHLSNQTNDLLEQMCDDNQLTKSEFIRRAIALMGVAMNYKKKGGHLVVLDEKDNKMTEITGL